MWNVMNDENFLLIVDEEMIFHVTRSFTGQLLHGSYLSRPLMTDDSFHFEADALQSIYQMRDDLLQILSSDNISSKLVAEDLLKIFFKTSDHENASVVCQNILTSKIAEVYIAI
ncbi:hypothetical protein QAD02_020645 [Eretmocerus hayati]|uniref:Uncharacterized protein n=1 Tax=Eretmocerus hayati TaxID=131215 RepID=A0ACC2PR77_9HYME|nr:hypothetical protein QAD02_020645 [Eretmocerus hayati]